MSIRIATRLGIRLTEERLSLLKTLLGQYYFVDVNEIKDDADLILGTVVEITLPLKPNLENMPASEETLDVNENMQI